MRILVTGGAGFVGSHLCEHLLADGHTVVALDNLSTGRSDNIAHLKGDFSLLVHDVCEPLPEFREQFDRIYHLACPASPIHYQADYVQTGKTNVLGTLNLLELARQQGARFLLTSTSEVYGDPLEHPQKESYRGNVNTVGVRSCYDEGKRMAETFTMDYQRQHGVDVRIVRIFNTYGPRMDAFDGRVVPTFIRQALRGESLSIFGEGQQTRSFQYVDDLINGLVTMMEQTSCIGPVNLGNPEEFTIREFADLVISLTGTQAKLEYQPLPADDPRQRRPDITLAKQELGWSPRVKLEEGLSKTIAWYRDNVKRTS